MSNMKIVTWSIVNNEIDFIADVIDYHIRWLDAMYVLDTGSTDGTLDILKNKALQYGSKIHIEEYHTKYIPEYNVPWEEMKNPFPEVDVRNYAIKRCKEIFKPDWLIQLDGDEIFLENVVDVIKKTNSRTVAINHSTINPVADLKTHRKEFRFGHHFYDPHSRIWNTKYNIEYIRNNNLKDKQFHCNPSVAGWNKHLFETPGTIWVKDNFHFHLHWMYGKKVESFFKKKGIGKSQMIDKIPMNEFSGFVPPVFIQRRKVWEINDLDD